jgi:hypothetical protein
MKEKVEALDSRYRALQESARANLRDLLLELPTAALTVPSAGVATSAEKELIVRKLEEAVGLYFKRSQPASEFLQATAQHAARLASAVDRFRTQAAGFDQEAAAPLASLCEDLRRLAAEIGSMAADSDSNRVRLNVGFEYSTLTASRQTLVQGLASGLESEISRFADAQEFARRRMSNLGSRAAAEAADLADSRLDPMHRNQSLQEALASIFAAGEIEEILPTTHEEYRATDHAVVQSIPGNGEGRPNTVAQALTRGFRHQDRVIRKANVVLFS